MPADAPLRPRQHRLHRRLTRLVASALAAAALAMLAPVIGASAGHGPVRNFGASGHPVLRHDDRGHPLDAHDGGIAVFAGRFYLYGTSYGCGFRWNHLGTRFCGFRAYSSTDLVHWHYEGELFNAGTRRWQTRCGVNGRGCFRPHVIYDRLTRRYVLWFNGFDTPVGYHVFTAARPTGPFHEAPVPHLHGPGADPAGINGDENLFVDTDGATYVIYTDWRTYGGLVVERLNRSATSGAGPHSRLPVHGAEAPSLFVREKRYFVTYSDPPCGYCARTGTSYAVARSPLGPWFKRGRVSADSCGGQPTMVTALGTRRDATFLYQSDLWDGGNANQLRANYYWGPLRFTSRETLARLRCLREWKLP